MRRARRRRDRSRSRRRSGWGRRLASLGWRRARRVPAAPGSVTSFPPGPRAAADPDEEWPDDAGPAGDGPGLTGMELIRRQLGGQVIQEIEDS